jgi:hypothetical protein
MTDYRSYSMDPEHKANIKQWIKDEEAKLQLDLITLDRVSKELVEIKKLINQRQNAMSIYRDMLERLTKNEQAQD